MHPDDEETTGDLTNEIVLIDRGLQRRGIVRDEPAEIIVNVGPSIALVLGEQMIDRPGMKTRIGEACKDDRSGWSVLGRRGFVLT